MRDMTVLDAAELAAIAAEHPYPLIFATVSGAHLYGFPSRNSDVDLRGVHLLPLSDVVGLDQGPETVDRSWVRNEAEVDLVTHDAAKFFRLLLRPNGYVLEQLLSPIVVHSSEAHRQLIAIAPELITRGHAHHYRGFANGQWKLFQSNREIKPLLYAFRVLLTGIHLMRTGAVLAHLPTLLEVVEEAPRFLDELIVAKVENEHGNIGTESAERFGPDLERLHQVLTEAETASQLPVAPSAASELNALLISLRLAA